MHQPHFSVEENQRFWEGNRASYQAEKNAGAIVFLARGAVGRDILDAGAGDGALLRELRRIHPEARCVGVDIAPKGADVEQGDLTRLRYDDSSFDTVFCAEVIEHTTAADTARILREIARVLKPAGHLILTTPYDEDLAESIVTCPTCNASFHRWGHQQRFVEADLERLARESGLEPLAVFPVKYSRVRRLRFLGPRFFRSAWMKARVRRAGGHRHLYLMARKRG
jgi:2-polyprenyl-3-methyl-5-hydroxy-6-metoxy-1,4-benzoquinol methylase